MIGRRDFFFFVPAVAFSMLMPFFLPPSSVSLSYFILAVPMRKRLGKHSCMSSPFPIAMLNGTFFFRSVKAMNNWKRSAIKQILLLLLLPFLIKFGQIMFIIIVFRLECDRPSGLLLFVPAVLFFHTHACLLSVFVSLIVLFRSCCSHSGVFGKTLVTSA